MSNEHVTVTPADRVAAEEIGGHIASWYEFNRRDDYEAGCLAAARFRIEATANVEPTAQALLQEARLALVKIRDGDDNWQITATEALAKLDAALGERP